MYTESLGLASVQAGIIAAGSTWKAHSNILQARRWVASACCWSIARVVERGFKGNNIAYRKYRLRGIDVRKRLRNLSDIAGWV